MLPNAVVLSTDILADKSGKVTEQSVTEKFKLFQPEEYQGKKVMIKGCAPSWAVLMLQHKLEGIAASLSFVLYDGKEYQIW
jgi:hypothetical protein